jgi:hypothetical protein
VSSINGSGRKAKLPPLREPDPISDGLPDDPIDQFSARIDSSGELSGTASESLDGSVDPEPKKGVGKAPRRPRRALPRTEDAPDPFEAALASLGISGDGSTPAGEESQPIVPTEEPSRPDFIDQLMQNIASGNSEGPNGAAVVVAGSTIDFPEASSTEEPPMRLTPVLQRRVPMKDDREMTFYRLCERDPSTQPIE